MHRKITIKNVPRSCVAIVQNGKDVEITFGDDLTCEIDNDGGRVVIPGRYETPSGMASASATLTGLAWGWAWEWALTPARTHEALMG